MWNWLAENYVTIIALLGVALLIAGAVFILLKDRKKSRSSCGGCCASCPYGGCCAHAAQKERKDG